MNRPDSDNAARVPTGVAGLDVILGGGLFRHAIYIVSGRPGAGKTILSNQVAFTHVRNGGRVVYATLLAETHGRLLMQLRGLSFFDEKVVGKELKYLSALEAITERGLPGLLDLVRSMVRDHRATLLVLDGMITAETLAKSEDEYKRFISALQTWVGAVGCTVLFLTSSGAESSGGRAGEVIGRIAPEHTMVDGIIELRAERVLMRNMRYLAVTKLRGGAFLEGEHSYLITGNGLAVFPRMEAQLPSERQSPSSERLSTGIPGLDEPLGGGIVSRSTTLFLGSSGSGKTVMGLQYLAEGARNGEKSLLFGFYEPPWSVIAKADRLGLDFTGLVKSGNLLLEWFRPAELLIDGVVDTLLTTVRKQKVTRLFIDGFVGFRQTHPPERISPVFSAVSDQLQAHDVTTIISDETRELFVREVEVPTANVSAIFHNIIFLRQVELDAELVRLLSVMKTRDSAADRRLWRYEITDDGASLLAPFGSEEKRLMLGGTGAKANRKRTRESGEHARRKPARSRGKER
jgi:circadian clock protein KaiC